MYPKINHNEVNRKVKDLCRAALAVVTELGGSDITAEGRAALHVVSESLSNCAAKPGATSEGNGGES
jgi:hypothetical protein